jgi:two-component system sensor histidine kinase BaeS
VKLSLAARMFAALFGMSAVMVALVVAWAGWALSDGFAVYLNNRSLAGMDRIAAALQQSYTRHGGWGGIAGNTAAWEAVLRQQGPPPMVPGWPLAPDLPLRMGPPGAPPGLPMPPPGGPPGGPDQDFGPPAPGPHPPGPHPPGPHHDPTTDYLLPRLALLDAQGRIIAGPSTAFAHAGRRILIANGKPQGELRFDAGEPTGGPEAAFLAARFTDLYGAGAAALVLSAIAALLISRNILVPVRLVADGARQLAAGNFSARLSTTRGDELGQLVRDFNALAADLESSEQSRRQWVADTSHELRTPLAILRAQIEALQDGVRAPNTETLAALHAETMRMARLVADLDALSRADSAALSLQKRAVPPAGILRGVLDTMAPQIAERRLRVATAGLGRAVPDVLADPDRLRQVFANIIENSLRYTDADGTIAVSAWAASSTVCVRVEDSAPGVPPASLPKLFERFYRGEESRNRATGGSGLGLAICKSIVEAHGGTIEAAASNLGGIAMTLHLPAAGTAAS